MFVFAFLNICACISWHLCLHFSTFVLAFLDICRIICLCIYPYLLDICGYIYGAGSTDVFLLDRSFSYINANICNNKCIRSYFAKIKSYFMSLHKIKYYFHRIKSYAFVVAFIDTHTYICTYIYFVYAYICSSIFRFVSVRLQAYM